MTPSAPAPSFEQRELTLDRVFFALSDRTRRALLERLRGGEETAGELADGFAVTRPAVSRHLRVLRQAALVRERRRGRERLYSLEPERLVEVGAWLDAYRLFWAARLQDLRRLVEELPEDPTPDPERVPPRPRSGHGGGKPRLRQGDLHPPPLRRRKP